MLRSLFRQRLVIAVLFISLMTMSQSLTMLPRTAFADTINPGVLDIGATLGGLTYGQWSEKWWQWEYSVTTFDDCPNQSGQTWFLTGAVILIPGLPPPVGSQPTETTVRKCTLPAGGKNIMFPVFNFEQSIAEAEATTGNLPKSTCPLRDVNGKLIKGTGYASLLRCAKAFTQHVLTQPKVSLGAEVDGKALKSLTHYRASSPPPLFPFTAVEGNPIGLCPLLAPCPLHTKAASDGFWIILGPEPLTTGMHTIHFTASVPFPEPNLNFTYINDVTYNLMVK
jgi:hypothetical protein